MRVMVSQKWLEQTAKMGRFMATAKPKKLREKIEQKHAAITPIELMCRANNYPAPKYEYRFFASRRWRFDACWPELKLAFELEGGIYPMKSGRRGAHSSVSGILRDIEKYNEAQLEGYIVIRVTPHQLKTGKGLAWIERALRQKLNLPAKE